MVFKMPKKRKKWCFVPYFGAKNAKKWRISAGLRAKLPQWGGKNASFCDVVGRLCKKTPPKWAVYIVVCVLFCVLYVIATIVRDLVCDLGGLLCCFA